jgi:hypothetical protein
MPASKTVDPQFAPMVGEPAPEMETAAKNT